MRFFYVRGCGLRSVAFLYLSQLPPVHWFVLYVPQRMVIEKIKAVHPEVPVIIYINKSGALLERMATSGVDIVSLDWTVTVPEARKRIGTLGPR